MWGIDRGINEWVISIWPAVVFIPAREFPWNSLVVDHILFWAGKWRLRVQIDLFKWVIGVYFGDDDSGIQIGPIGISWECYDLHPGWEKPTGPKGSMKPRNEGTALAFSLPQLQSTIRAARAMVWA
jgi:hypothetical protein